MVALTANLFFKLKVHNNFRGGANAKKTGEQLAHEGVAFTEKKLQHTSFSPGIGNECHRVLDNKDLSLDFACNSLMAPQTWQKTNPDGQYDLAIVGGGIGAAYLAYRLQESFKANGEPLPKIALFERTERLGGRLVSAYGAGALGLSVIPRNGNMTSEDLPLQEYGGMRIDPYRYPLVFNTAIKIGKKLSSDAECQYVADEGANAECPVMLVRMDVANVRFATTAENLGSLMSDSKYSTETENRYCMSDIANGNGAPFDKCIQLAVSTIAHSLY